MLVTSNKVSSQRNSERIFLNQFLKEDYDHGLDDPHILKSFP